MRSVCGFTVRQWDRIGPTVVGILLALVSVNVAFAQQAPPGTTSKYLSRFQATGVPAQFDLVQTGLDFAPGVSTPDYAYGGTAYNTVMGGQITVRENGAEKVYRAGDTWTDPAGQVHSLRNDGADHALVDTSLVLGTGAGAIAGQSANGAGAPAGPASVFLTRFPVSGAPSPLDVVQVELAQDPGSWTATHTHPGAAYSTLIRGQLAVRADGAESTYGPGGSWVNPAGQIHAVGVVSPAPSLTFTTFLVPRSATQVSTPVSQPQKLPVTGRGSTALDAARPAWLALLAILMGLVLLGLRRRAAR